MRNKIRLTESQLHQVIKESVRRILRESVNDEVEDIVSSMGSNIEDWVNDHNFYDTHGFNGYIFNSEEEAVDAVLNGDEHQNAIDYIDGAQSEDEWVKYLIDGGVDADYANEIVENQDWDAIIKIIVDSDGPEWFLSDYSGKVHNLSNGQLLYY